MPVEALQTELRSRAGRAPLEAVAPAGCARSPLEVLPVIPVEPLQAGRRFRRARTPRESLE